MQTKSGQRYNRLMLKKRNNKPIYDIGEMVYFVNYLQSIIDDAFYPKYGKITSCETSKDLDVPVYVISFECECCNEKETHELFVECEGDSHYGCIRKTEEQCIKATRDFLIRHLNSTFQPEFI